MEEDELVEVHVLKEAIEVILGPYAHNRPNSFKKKINGIVLDRKLELGKPRKPS